MPWKMHLNTKKVLLQNFGIFLLLLRARFPAKVKFSECISHLCFYIPTENCSPMSRSLSQDCENVYASQHVDEVSVLGMCYPSCQNDLQPSEVQESSVLTGKRLKFGEAIAQSVSSSSAMLPGHRNQSKRESRLETAASFAAENCVAKIQEKCLEKRNTGFRRFHRRPKLHFPSTPKSASNSNLDHTSPTNTLQNMQERKVNCPICPGLNADKLLNAEIKSKEIKDRDLSSPGFSCNLCSQEQCLSSQTPEICHYPDAGDPVLEISRSKTAEVHGFTTNFQDLPVVKGLYDAFFQASEIHEMISERSELKVKSSTPDCNSNPEHILPTNKILNLQDKRKVNCPGLNVDKQLNAEIERKELKTRDLSFPGFRSNFCSPEPYLFCNKPELCHYAEAGDCVLEISRSKIAAVQYSAFTSKFQDLPVINGQYEAALQATGTIEMISERSELQGVERSTAEIAEISELQISCSSKDLHGFSKVIGLFGVASKGSKFYVFLPSLNTGAKDIEICMGMTFPTARLAARFHDFWVLLQWSKSEGTSLIVSSETSEELKKSLNFADDLSCMWETVQVLKTLGHL